MLFVVRFLYNLSPRDLTIKLCEDDTTSTTEPSKNAVKDICQFLVNRADDSILCVKNDLDSSNLSRSNIKHSSSSGQNEIEIEKAMVFKDNDKDDNGFTNKEPALCRRIEEHRAESKSPTFDRSTKPRRKVKVKPLVNNPNVPGTSGIGYSSVIQSRKLKREIPKTSKSNVDKNLDKPVYGNSNTRNPKVVLTKMDTDDEEEESMRF